MPAPTTVEIVTIPRTTTEEEGEQGNGGGGGAGTHSQNAFFLCVSFFFLGPLCISPGTLGKQEVGWPHFGGRAP